MIRLPLLFAILSLATVAWACLWDDDTLSIEAKGLPSVVDAIVGRVAINPPEYYEARIPRSLERLARDPDDYEAYDNLAVAYDKLGQSEKAREILEKKRAQLVARRFNRRRIRPATRGTATMPTWAPCSSMSGC